MACDTTSQSEHVALRDSTMWNLSQHTGRLFHDDAAAQLTFSSEDLHAEQTNKQKSTMSSDTTAKIMAMPWNPLKRLANLKRHQFRFTDQNNNQGFFLHPTNNGLDVHLMIEHIHFFPQAVSGTTLTDLEKARQYGVTLQPPASAIYARVLAEQEAEGETDLDMILNTYLLERLGEHGNRAAYHQLEGLRTVKKPIEIKCFEWETLFVTGNDAVDRLPGVEGKMEGATRS